MQTKADKGEGVSVQVDVHIYTTLRPRRQRYNTGLQALHYYIAQGISALKHPLPAHSPA